MASVFLIACGGTASTTVDTIDAANFEDYQADDETPIWRYVNSGWVVPVKEKYSDAFARDSVSYTHLTLPTKRIV